MGALIFVNDAFSYDTAYIKPSTRNGSHRYLSAVNLWTYSFMRRESSLNRSRCSKSFGSSCPDNCLRLSHPHRIQRETNGTGNQYATQCSFAKRLVRHTRWVWTSAAKKRNDRNKRRVTSRLKKGTIL